MLNFLIVVHNGITSLCRGLYFNADMSFLTQVYARWAGRHTHRILVVWQLLWRRRGVNLSFMRLSAVSAACCTRLSTLCRPLCCNSSLCCSLSCSETEYPSRPSVRTCITHAHHASKLSLRCVVQWLLMHVQLGLTDQLCFIND